MGLSLVERLVALHGGWIWVDDVPGGGAAFNVVFPQPVARVEPAERGERRSDVPDRCGRAVPVQNRVRRDVPVPGSVGLKGLMRTRPRVALVDVRLPDGSGVELIRDVRSRMPDTRCIIFTSYADDDAFFQSVVAGAAGYVVKDADHDALAEAIRTVAAGKSLMSPEALDDLRARATSLPPDDDFLLQLTGQERRILSMVAQGMTNREIALELSLAEKTVRNYVSNILIKVGIKNRTQLAAYVARALR